MFTLFAARAAGRAGARRGLRTVPDHITRPQYAATGAVLPSPAYVILQSAADVDGLRRAGQAARKALEFACSLVEVSTCCLRLGFERGCVRLLTAVETAGTWS
jgi:hypothetical protein